MTDLNVHPTIIRNVKAVLPLGATLTAVVSTGPETGEIRYKEIGGEEHVSKITKASPMIGLGNHIMRFPAEEGAYLKDVIEKFCAQYKLMMLSGADYDVGDRKVEFDGEEFYTEVVQILPTSALLNGNLTLILVDADVKCDAVCLDPNDPKKRDVYILLSKPFEVEGEILTEEALSEAAVDVICDHAKACGGFVAMDRETLIKGVATPLSSDGVTQYTCVSTELGDFGIRFKSK